MYSEAQLKIDDRTDRSPVAKGLRVLNKLAKILHQKRIDSGALMLASSEVMIVAHQHGLTAAGPVQSGGRRPRSDRRRAQADVRDQLNGGGGAAFRGDVCDGRRSSCCWPT